MYGQAYDGMSEYRFLNFTIAFALTLMIGRSLAIGRNLLLPVIVAVIVVYIVSSASEALRKLPLARDLPALALNIVLLAGFGLVFLALALLVASTIDQIVSVARTYQANIMALISSVAKTAGIDQIPNWEQIRKLVFNKIDFGQVLIAILGSVTNIGTTSFLIIVYAAFLVKERIGFPDKLCAAFPEESEASAIRQTIEEINQKIGNYLAVKTAINIVLAFVSYIVLLAFGIDFAVFWALAIGLMNYIPYFGSLLGVALPVLVSMAQFATISTTALLAVVLTVAQMYVGNVLEPRLIGRQLNLSPFVVLLALSVWTTLWGVQGAILAIPLTSVLVIIARGFESTRFIAILMSNDVADKSDA